MRDISNKQKIIALMDNFGKKIKQKTCVYFTGGATAVLLNIRETTIDVDLTFEPELDEVFVAIRDLKDSLEMNIEIASPAHFIPPLPGYKGRHLFIDQKGNVGFFHFDLYTQVLAKVQRGWDQDLRDAKNFVKYDVQMDKLVNLFKSIKNDLIRFPAVEPKQLEKKLLKFYEENK